MMNHSDGTFECMSMWLSIIQFHLMLD